MADEDGQMWRRELLQTVGATGMAALAGCSGYGSDGPSGNGQEDGSGIGENGTPVNGGSNETDPGNGQQNGGENGSENGGQDGQPEELLESAEILDGQEQKLESLTLGDGEDATTNAEIYLGIEGNGEAQYTSQTDTDLEKLAKALNQEGTVTPENPVQLAELNWQNLNEEQVNTQLQATAQNQGGQVNASLPITVQEDSLNLQKIYEDNLAKREEAIQNTKKSKGNYKHSFTDLENLRKIADFYGLDLNVVNGPVVFGVINDLDDSTRGLDSQDLSNIYTSSEPYDDGVMVSRNFTTGIDAFNTESEGFIWRGMGDGQIIQYTGGEEFPDTFEDFLAGDAPSIADETEGDEYTDWGFHETDVWEDNIVLFYGDNLGIPGATSYEKFPIWSFNTIMMDPETGELRETFFNSQKNGEDEIVWEADPVHDYRNLEPERLGGYQFSY